MQYINIDYNGYLITTDKNCMRVEHIHQWLSEKSHWSQNIPFENVKKSFDNSFCIGVLQGDRQVGYGRLITDYSFFAYMADVYIEEEHRGFGLGKKMIEVLMNLDWVRGLRSIKLTTRDARSLYEKFGFTALTHPERMMEISFAPNK